MTNKKYKELSISELDYSVSQNEIQSCKQQNTKIEIIGQPRAMRALRFGFGINDFGYNIFVIGNPGTGRHSTVRNILAKYTIQRKLKDIVCVCNFSDQDSPDILYLPRGKAVAFKEELHNFITLVKKQIHLQTENKLFKSQREQLIKSHETKENQFLDSFEDILAQDNFKLITNGNDSSEPATEIVPVYNGKPTNFEELHRLLDSGEISKAQWEDLRTKYYRHMDAMQELLRNMETNKSELGEKLHELEKNHTRPFLESGISILREIFRGKEIMDYLTSLVNDILDNLFLFTDDSEDTREAREIELQRYEVNIIADNSKTRNCPVIFETHPTYNNLFGTIELKSDSANADSRPNFTMIKAGSLIKASGGFIIINAEDLFQEENSWEYLKRTLKSGEIQIQSLGSPLNMLGTSIKPKPVKVDVKVILIGSEKIYDILYESDEYFTKLFKVSAEFDLEMEASHENINYYVQFIMEMTKKRKFLPVSDDGIIYIIKYGKRIVEDKNKLSTSFSKILDILTQANYWAKSMGMSEITKDTLRMAEEEHRYFQSLTEDKLTDMLVNGTIKIQVDGSRVGAINALTVMTRGSYSYGRPSLLTATCSSGDHGIINIEHEAGLSGEIFDKGVMIIEGYLRSFYSDNFNMSFWASICFEQSYGMIDGDSASSSEIYALLSSISGIPLRQDIAATGSVNQFGEIQPVGGISEKIAGFYTICKRLGLTGNQGVIVPESNIYNILLPDEVMEAVAAGQFHIYPISTINQGLEILTGMKAGEKNARGQFPVNSFNALVLKKMKALSIKSKDSK